MLIEVTANEYKHQFGFDPHPFISESFIELNRKKVDRIVRLVESGDSSIGIVAGIKDGLLKNPFSAPFGGFHYHNELIFISVIESFLEGLKEYARNNDIKQIFISLPPPIYQKTFNAKTVNSLIRTGYKMVLPDITFWVDLNQFNNKYSYQRSRECYKEALKKHLKFNILDSQDEKRVAYEIIKENRLRVQRPIYMSFDELDRTGELIQTDFFGVFNSDDQMVASAIFYKFPLNIVYAVFWGDSETGRHLRAMDFMVYNLYCHYKSAGYQYIDLSISTECGNPNEGLTRFKETHEGTSSVKFSFCWSS